MQTGYKQFFYFEGTPGNIDMTLVCKFVYLPPHPTEVILRSSSAVLQPSTTASKIDPFDCNAFQATQ